MSEGTSGISDSEDTALHVEYMETIPTKMPKVKVKKHKQRQRQVKVGGGKL